MNLVLITHSVSESLTKDVAMESRDHYAQAFTFVRILRLTKIGKALRILNDIQSFN